MKARSAALAVFLDRLEAVTRSRGFQLLRRLEPAFIVFTVVGVMLATYTLRLDLQARNLDLAARHEERTSRAWQTVASEAPGNTGKREALEFLAANGHALNRTDVSPNSVRKDGDRTLLACDYRVYLPSLDLSEAVANRANLSCTEMDADEPQHPAAFDNADLEQAAFLRANAERASFRQARLTSADFRGAQLGQADFGAADLTRAEFGYASLRYVIFEGATLDAASVDHATLEGASGLTCGTLRTMTAWQTACRSDELRCGEPIPPSDSCGPAAIPMELRFPRITPLSPSPAAAAETCENEIDMRREVEFRVDQMDSVVFGTLPINQRDKSPSCNRATSIYVAARLSGIAQRPPPKEDETVWIGGAGYGYRHIPFKTGARSDEFISFNLPQLGADYLECVAVEQDTGAVKGQLEGAVESFNATTASGEDEVQQCSEEWIRRATDSWRLVAESARSLLAYNQP